MLTAAIGCDIIIQNHIIEINGICILRRIQMYKLMGLIITFLFILNISSCANGYMKSFITEKIVLNSDTEYELDGLLTIPKEQNNKVPAVVLVHGSGSTDMDGCMYEYKPFKDIANYLSSNGIAVLRYDKRTYTHGVKMAENLSDITVREEIIDDAIAAANLLRADDRIDSDKIFILGHSLGGMLAPRIDAEGGDFSGLIICSGSPRKLSEVILEQLENGLEDLTESQKESGRQQVDFYRTMFEKIKEMSNDEAKNGVMLGASLYYFKEIDSHPTSDYICEMTKPILIMQGGKDFQVHPEKDYVYYQNLLNGKNNVTFKLYAELNHYFIKSTSGTIDEYYKNDKVNEDFLQDIVDWIKAQ